MSTPTHTIENLMKVSLNLAAGNAPTGETADTPFTFIYGVGPAGITPFEKALFGRGVGESVTFDIAPGDYCTTVGHLELPLREQTGIAAPDSLRVTITAVVRAKDREVVRAMAAGGSCSDCGCGCGGH
ncbi:hypothetical protein [Desulfosarcina sp.]|uniref:hypothetical protein n=1 Tax=Desulfosarcina sp. TaxID=2027861 RepID=UPI003971148C